MEHGIAFVHHRQDRTADQDTVSRGDNIFFGFAERVGYRGQRVAFLDRFTFGAEGAQQPAHGGAQPG